MIKLIVLLKRKPGITREEFSRHWREKHGPLVVGVTESSVHMRRYIQNHIVSGPDDLTEEGFDGIFEGWYESREALARVSATRGYRDLIHPDELTFMDHAGCVTYIVDEHIVIGAADPPRS